MLNSIKYILAIAEYERKMLYRKPKFWILAGIGVLFIIFFLFVMTLISIIGTRIPGEFLLEATDAYLALYFFSYLQAVLIIFVAGDFRSAEEKARLDEVMLSKPMTTANWVIGKYLGVVSALFYLNFFLLFLATVGRFIKVLMTGAGFNILPFLEYFVIASVPSILFMTAMMFFLVSLLRSQAFALLVSGGYVASIWFYFHHKFQGLLDYGCFFAPLFWSDFIGFGDIHIILLQRLFFVVLAGSLLAFSILLYPRLGQSLFSKRLSVLAAGTFLCAATFLAVNMIRSGQAVQLTQQDDRAFQKMLAAEPICKVHHYDLDVSLTGESAPLTVNAKLRFSNPNKRSLEKLIFSLNGKLRVLKVTWLDGAEISFDRKHQLLILELGNRTLAPGSVDSVQIIYSGEIDADSFMLSRLPESPGLIDKSDGPWFQGNISAWLSRDVVILPWQCGWYPTPGVTAGHDFETPPQKTFASVRIAVKADSALTVITQGKNISESTDGTLKTTNFEIKKPVSGLSLIAGTFKRLAHKFSQAEIEIYFHPKHLLDYEIFTDVADTCYEAVESVLTSFEQVTGVSYPYDKLTLVEVPLQMQVYTTEYGFDNILQQPGMVLIDEVTIASKRLKKDFDKKTKRARKDGRDDSPQKIKRDLFVEIVLDIFMDNSFRRGDVSLRSPLRNYVNFQMDIRDPVLDRALQLYYYEAAERRIRDLFYPDRWNAALSSYDRMRQNEWGGWTVRRRYDIEIDSLIARLAKTPLAAMRPEKDGNLFRACIDFKAPPILQILSERIGERNYSAAVGRFLDEFRYKSATRADFLSAVQSTTDENLEGFFEQWFEQATFPGYRITQARAEKLDTGKMKIAYQVTTRIQNGEKGDGFVRLVCETKNDKIRRNVELASYQEKEVKLVLNEEPTRVKVIPYFSRNRGAIIKEISIDKRIRRGIPVDTVLTTTSISDSMFFILDDQDEGFFTPIASEAKYLRPPSKGSSWRERTNPFAYGKYYFGFQVKQAGSGDYPARWETQVPKDGDYELSFYYTGEKSWYTRNASRHFKVNVTSDDGTFSIELQSQDTPDGWIPLGRFHFSRSQTAVIELQDEGNGYLIADAIRWEYVE
ncbi:MAG: hypothetical protein ACE5IR_05235 [bacterium]